MPADRIPEIFGTGVLANPSPPKRGTLPPEEEKLRKEDLGALLRYLAAPPISSDDLKVLAEVDSLTSSRLAIAEDEATDDSERDGPAQRVLSTILQALDSQRFPWIAAGRMPTPSEREAAILASAALITAQRVATDRRTESKKAQEKRVRDFLTSLGFTAVPARGIRTLDDAPLRGQFCPESMVGSRKADIAVRLFDGRLMPIECKVSNSVLNSVKRINNDAAVKASIWRREFGENQVVPTAVLTGVFRAENLMEAQKGGLTLFWARDLAPLRDFIASTRAAR